MQNVKLDESEQNMFESEPSRKPERSSNLGLESLLSDEPEEDSLLELSAETQVQALSKA